MALDAVTKALKNLPNESSRDDENSLNLDGLEDHTYYCVEDTFLSKDINIIVEGVGNLAFPISTDTVNNLIKVSSKAKFGRGEDTVLDTSVRDTQMIPASKLKVEINKDSLKNILERIAFGLKIHENSTLVPHLYNMLIYGPGQFFRLHRDSEKEQNMVATLVIVLPCSHKGGDLVVQHQNKQHVFFGSRNPDFIKCVMFYSDCQHEIKKVTEGFRIALTYNVVLQSPEILSTTNINQELNEAVASYFNSPNERKRLIYYLNHNYSENSLKWNLLKGTDRNEAFSLFTVAKHQGLVPCLALLEYRETCDSDDLELIDDETTLIYWVDEQNIKFKDDGFDNIHVSEDEICYTSETKDILEPYKTEESGPTGNAGETRDHWYQRACVVLWSKRQHFAHGFKYLLYDLHKYTITDGNEAVLLEEIRKIGQGFFKKNLWTEQVVIEMLLDIVFYLHDSEIAVSILSQIPGEVLSLDRIEYLMKLENQHDNETWTRIFELWKKHSNWYSIAESSYNNIKKFLKVSSKHYIANGLLKETVDSYIRSTSYGQHKKYGPVEKNQTDRLADIFQDCFDSERLDLVDKLFHFTLSSSNVHNLLSLTTVLCKLKVLLSPSKFLRCKPYRDPVLTAINIQISQVTLNINDWNLPYIMPCRCNYCSKVQTFFCSKSATRVVVPAAKHFRRHVYSYLNPLAGKNISFHTERTGSPYKIIVEKDQDLFSDRQKLLKGLKSSKQSLEELAFEEIFIPSNETDVEVPGEMLSNTLPQMLLDESENSVESTSESAETSAKRLKRI